MSSIEIKDVTVGTIDGDGVFDQIMKSVNAQLESQFSKGRITGPDYANVYLGSVQSAMSQAIQFVLGRQAADKQAELLAAQILTELSNGKNADKQGLILDEELNAALERIKLLQEQIQNEHAQHADTLIDGITLVAGLIAKQKEQLTADINLADQKRFTEEAQIDDNPNGLPLAGLLAIAKNKTIEETLFVTQKKLTEEAQVKNTLSDGTVVYVPGATPTGNGTIGRQQVLINKQTDGFDRDAEQKVLKVMIDSWNIGSSLNPTSFPQPTGLTSSDITSAIDAARTGAGL